MPGEPPDSSPTAAIPWKSKATGCVCSATFVSLVKRRLMSAHMNPPDSRCHSLVSFISKAVEIVGCNKWKGVETPDTAKGCPTGHRASPRPYQEVQRDRKRVREVDFE